MAKRANPFSDDFIQQSKIHVGLKQFNNNEERLEKVYKKTLDILFKGAKKPHQDNVIKNNITINLKKDGLKQLFLATDGTLLHSGEMVQGKEATQCKCGGTKTEFCAYCEAALCSACEKPCSLCCQVYCGQCSLFVAEGSEVCVSCYG